MSLTRLSCASASAAMTTACRVALGLLDHAQALDVLLLLGHGLAPPRRARGSSAIERFSSSTSMSLAIADSSVSRSRAMTSSSAVLLDALGLDRDDALAVLLRDRDLAGLVLALRCRAAPRCARRAVSARSRSSAWTFGDLGLLAGPRGLDLALLLDLASACSWRSSSRIASAASTSCLISFSSLRWSSLVRTCSIAVSSVIFRMPCGVEDVVRVEQRDRGLLEVVDGGVLEACSR